MTPFVSPTLVALGHWLVPVLIVILAVLVAILERLLRKPNVWRVSLACVIVGFIALQLAPLVVR
jgi:hypothetical protein